MLRKFVVILTMLLCSMATQVYALGLGSVSVESSLNQPLQVHIELLQLADTRLEDVSVRMASPDDFQRFNIERVGFLSNVRISLEATPTGNIVILSSNQVVREPYLSFILETRWPGGRLLSEHTILLDLPVFDDQQAATAVRQPISPVLRAPEPDPATAQAAAASAPAVRPATSAGQINSGADLQPEIIGVAETEDEVVAEPEPEPASAVADEVLAVDEPPAAAPIAQQEPQVEDEPAPTAVLEEEPQAAVVVEEIAEEIAEEIVEEVVEEEPQVEVAEEEVPAAAIAAVEAEPEEQAPESIETSSTDTLSDIAMRVRQDSAVSMQQTMLAIQQLNPDAFTDGNINRLRSGQILRIPSLAEIQAVDARQAIDEVVSQNQQFASADIQPLAAPANTAPVQDNVQQGRLSVVSSDAELIDVSSAASSGQDSDELAELDRRIVELENQLAASQEEADRARIERETLNQRLQELESQIAATQEIIRLQDIRLAQLQDSLAQAAEIAEQEAALAAVQAEAAQPIESPSNRTLIDDLFRILGANNTFVIFGVALIILLLVLLLLRRNSAAKHDDEEIDEIAEQAFDSSDAGGVDEEEPVKESEYQDFDATDLNSELNEIIGIDDEQKDSEEIQDLDIGDLDEESSERNEADTQASEIGALLDDMGIDSFDDIDDTVSGLTDKEDDAETLASEQADFEEPESLESEGSEVEEIEILEPDEPEVEEVEILEPDEQEVEEIETLEVDEPESIQDLNDDVEAEDSEEAVEDASENAAEELESFEFRTEDLASESAESTAKDEEDLQEEPQIDTLEFEAGPLTEIKVELQSEDEEEPELETFSFVADEPAASESESEASNNIETELEIADDPNAVSFEFDKDEMVADSSSEDVTEKEELETFEFALDEAASDAVKEAPDELAESVDEESPDVEEELPKVELELADDDDDDDLEFLSDDFEIDLGPDDNVEEIELLPNYDESESATKLELAYAYQKMGDPDGAKEILREVIKEGNEEQIAEAKRLLNSIDGSTE